MPKPVDQAEVSTSYEIAEMPIRTYYDRSEYHSSNMQEYIDRILQEQKSDRQTKHDSSFYLNSSDSLEILMKVSMEGKRVLTVTGSGEFSEIFIGKGAREVCSFDISPAAAYYGEMRHVGLCTLAYEDYVKMFSPWTSKRRASETAPLFDVEIYERMKGNLSDDAQAYFDLLLENQTLLNQKMDSSFSRTRTNQKTKNNRLFGDIITDEASYYSLQNIARKTRFTQVIWDASSSNELIAAFKPDSMYITNVGYSFQRTADLANTLLEQGVGEVIFSAGKYESPIYNSDYIKPGSKKVNGAIQEDAHLNHKGQPLSPGSKFVYRHRLGDKSDSINDPDPDPSHFVLLDVELIGYDLNADYGAIIKVTKHKEEELQ